MTSQRKIHAGFGPATTAAEVIAGIDLTGKTALVTGGYSGLGLETTRVLAAAGAEVIVPARSMEKASRALAGIEGVRPEVLDLMDPASTDALAVRVVGAGRPLHMLINSAGIMASPLARDARGNEAQFSTNHLGHFRLTRALWPALRQAQGARVISYASRGHRIGGVDFDDPNFERRAYDKWLAYGQSKTANALFALELDRRGAADGIRSFSVHPGSILTDLARSLTDEEIAGFDVHDAKGRLRNDPENDIKSVPQGAATGVWAAVSPALEGLGGVYCEDCDVADPWVEGGQSGVAAWAMDPVLAERLWTLSEALDR